MASLPNSHLDSPYFSEFNKKHRLLTYEIIMSCHCFEISLCFFFLKDALSHRVSIITQKPSD